MGFRGAAQGFRGAAPWGFEGQHQVGWDLKGQHHGVSRGSTMGFRGAATSGMGPQGAAEGPQGTATWDRVIEGIFLIFQCNRF